MYGRLVRGCLDFSLLFATIRVVKLNRAALHVIRERTRLSKSQLAALSGLSAGAYSDLESGRRNASEDVIGRLAEALDVPIPAIARTEDAAA